LPNKGNFRPPQKGLPFLWGWKFNFGVGKNYPEFKRALIRPNLSLRNRKNLTWGPNPFPRINANTFLSKKSLRRKLELNLITPPNSKLRRIKKEWKI